MFVDTQEAVLNDQQRAAVAHDGGNLLIVAGAGTGKTTTLAARLAHLLDRGVAPERILLLTFTRRAAVELIGRAEHRCGHDVARRVWSGTFHSVGARLLRRHGGAIGVDPGFSVLDQADTADLLHLVRSELHAHDGVVATEHRRAKKATMADVLSRVVNTGIPLGTVLRTHFPWCAAEQAELASVFAAYTARKRSAMVLDYDDLLRCWLALLRSPASEVVRAHFDHVLVDEYQDTNALQADILDALVSDAAGAPSSGATVTAVGDDAQAIFGFRAATPRNILDFPTRFRADVVVLEHNHRSTPEILAMANTVVGEAVEQHRKVLRTTRPPGSRPMLVSCADEAAQSAAVCRRILEHHERGGALRDQAVLFRTGHHSALLELELTARRIPFRKYGGLRFLEAAHVKDLVCALRLVNNPRDELAWFRVLQLIDGIGPAIARRASAAAPPLDIDALPAMARPHAVALVAALHAAAGDPPGAALERLRQWLSPLLARHHGDAAARNADLQALADAASGAPSLARFLTELTLDPPASTGDLAGPPGLDDDWLTLSTIHSAKGGEWDVVHLIHLADGNLPSDLATGDADQIEEERRLLYVAVTRARDELRCYVPLRYHHASGRGRLDDRHSYAQPSRFLTAPVLATMDRSGDAATAGDGPGVAYEPSTALAQLDADLAALFDS